MRVLVTYASKHGSTEGIAQAIGDRLRERGLEVDVAPVGRRGDVGDASAVILGSAVYVGSWIDEAVEFAERNAETLVGMPVWLFSSGPLGEHVDDDEEQPRQLAELRGLVAPLEHRTFFGALDKAKLGFGERLMVKAVRAPDGDFRDWEAIRGWSDAIADRLLAGEGS
jgi:menaquinone-dependent protoporphyrinogen oxidase